MSSSVEYIYDSLSRMGYMLRDFGKEFRAKPIYRNSENSMSLVVNKETGKWFDHSARIGGDFDTLVKLTTKNLSLTDFNISAEYEGFSFRTVSPQLSLPRTFDKNLLIKLLKNHDYWLGRGISRFTIEIFEGGISENGKMANRYVFPIFDQKNNLVGFDGRYLEPNSFETVPKWKIIGDKSHWVYPLRYNKDILLQSRSVILVESIGDMLALWDAGIKNTLVTFGVQLSAQLVTFLIQYDFDEIIIAFNNDSENNNVGNQASTKALRKLSNYFDANQLKIRLPAKKDFNEMSLEERKLWMKNL